MSSHLELDALADLLAGEGTDEGVAHLAACADCAGALAALDAADAQVGDALSALAAEPVPPLPDDVAARLDAAVAALAAELAAGLVVTGEPVTGELVTGAGVGEPVSTAVAPPPAPPPVGGTVTTLPTASREDRRAPRSAPRWLPAAAAAVVVLGGAGFAFTQLGDGTTGSEDSATAAADGAGSAANFGTASGLDYADRAALQAALPGLLAADGARASKDVQQEAAAAPRDASAAPPNSDGSATPTLTTSSGQAGPDAAAALQRLREPAALASCLAALTGPDDTSLPLALDFAAYMGQPALVVVLRAPDAPDKVDVFVVGPACTQADEALLFFTRLDAA